MRRVRRVLGFIRWLLLAPVLWLLHKITPE